MNLNRRLFLGRIGAASATAAIAAPTTASTDAKAAINLSDDEAAMLIQYRRLSPQARSEHLGWAKWQADRCR